MIHNIAEDDSAVAESGASPPDLQTAIRKRSVKIAGHSTSLSLEGVFWDALKEVAAARGLSINALIEEIDRGRGANLSSAVRVYLLNRYRGTGGAGTSPPDPSAGS
jgi:predicted DNA-binding ribbon-helix-helix protein